MNEPNFPTRGPVAGKYEILQLIGRGGMGSVWEGRHASLGTRVAIKFVDPEFADSEEARRRFMTEARAAATIRSKFAIQIFDHGLTDDGRPYIVMELLTGEPLDRRLERCGRLALADTARIIGQVCRALQRAHDAGIIHRDLKPENVFLVRSPDDEEEIAKVLDFGIAKFRGPPGGLGMSSSTKTGAVIGTPFFMSPEQARGLRDIDHRTDLWSLGVIAYKSVTGVLPFDGVSVGDLLVKICTAPTPVPSHAVPGLPAAFDGWFARALEKDPERRFRTASELADALALSAGLSPRAPIGASGPLPAVTAAAAARSPSEPEEAGASDPLATPYPRTSGSSPRVGEVTSAPFTSPAFVPRSPRTVAIAAIGAAVLGGSLGVLAVVKVVTATRASTPADAPATADRVASAAAVDAAPAALAPIGPDGLEAGPRPSPRNGAGPAPPASGPAAASNAGLGHVAPPSSARWSAPAAARPSAVGPPIPAPTSPEPAGTGANGQRPEAPAATPPKARPASATPNAVSADPGY